ncbi:bifunctional 2-C-methyl-D-erythritol 4-phosphate cytidylyltransferase/2-C-methyl-D-erythritol 2,4-cyclodiphosphate synthase [Methylocapsa palsarum]|uniref:Bifunctional enzyme IspD/IspF n=1 Tax=Methylocapsa palsarum TaxID=1612308 RepID=A0A1I3Y956_9HYPH|nr:bifunctional 2-C-methyl-D-erythritol 4-phosphate cytidylyltransferase/2-C-methyl-D-erythritol 2,4-cyclodiphosphate synthase [Methylocapsa palsarum]SFK28240.1 2-C-methyl-D-erythritol 4-phosphate cytidylyltransferase / 2-C-methyl-D-erythritol 2,4-cyclodiphosphate synthase [Methylocapsa palsarum]
MTARPHISILVVAAGRGSRAGGGLPKQYRPVAGRPLLAHSLEALCRAAPDASILPVIHSDDLGLYSQSVAALDRSYAARLREPVFGGATRQASVRAGLEALASGPSAAPEIVLIHDAARMFSGEALLSRALDAAIAHGAAIPGIAVTDTIKEIDSSAGVVATPPRSNLRAVQTPQAFRFDLILEAHRQAAAAGQDELTDDGAIAEWAGHRVHVFEGEPGNMKVTSAEDLVLAEARFIRELPDIRIGQGYDVHAFGTGDHVWLGGVKVPHDRGLVGHSDADVLSHAITDALLGALAEGDIGSHFPPSDPQWRGAASKIFLAHAAERVRARGGMIANIDATLICERPKVGPHRDAIRESLAAICGVPAERVAVKATTSEKLGFTGREEGMAALALATVRLPM